MLNPAGLRRFPSPHSSLFFLDFWWNFRAQMRREGEGWGFYKGGDPGRPRGGGRQAPPVARRGGATGPPAATVGRPSGGRPWAGRQAPVAPPTGDRACFFFSRDFVANLKKKLHIGPVALWEGDRGIFLKYLKTDIYF